MIPWCHLQFPLQVTELNGAWYITPKGYFSNVLGNIVFETKEAAMHCLRDMAEIRKNNYVKKIIIS